MNTSQIMDLFIDNIKKVVFPEEWISIDLALSKQEIFILMLVERSGEIIMSKVAEYVNVSMSTATGIVDRLVKNGYLERNRSESDRRVVMIKLTEKAKQVVNEIKSIGTDLFNRVADALSTEEREFLGRIAVKVIGELSKNSASAREGRDEAAKITRIEIE